MTLHRLLTTRRAELTMALVGVVWMVWLGSLAIHRFYGLGFGAFDLGIFDQGVWLLSRFEEPFITLRGLHLFADHASYFLFLIAPLYWVVPSPIVLILLCVAIPVAAAWLSFAIARQEGLRPWPAAGVGAAVLFMPAMAWTPWDAFHPETFAIALFPASYLAARRGRFTLAVVLAALILLVKEDSGLLVAPYALFMWFRWKEARKHAYLLAGLSVAIQAISLLVILPALSPTGELIYTGRYPLDFADLMTWPRLLYLVAMLVPAFLAFRAPWILALGLPITLANLASTHGYQHEIMWHYTAYLLGVLAVAVPVGAARAWDRAEDRRGTGRRSSFGGPEVVTVALMVSLLGLLTAGPDLTTRFGLWQGISAEELAEFDRVMAAIPDDAVVSAHWNLAPHLSQRRLIYMAPNPFVDHYWGVRGRYPPLPDPRVVEFLVIDTRRIVEEIEAVRWVLSEGWVVEHEGTFSLYRNPSPVGVTSTNPR